MRYPYQRFLRFLVSRKVAIDETIGKYGLSSVGDFWESDCRKDIRGSAPHSVVSHIDSDDYLVVLQEGFLQWAENEGIRPLWITQREFGGTDPSPALDAAIQIFVNPSARAVTGLLILSDATDDESIELLRSRFNLEITQETMTIYQKIFWDVTAMKDADWNTFLGDIEVSDERNLIAFGLNSPSIENIRLFLEEKPDITPDFVLNRILAIAYTQLEAAGQQVDAETAGTIRWADMAMRAINTMATHKKAFGGDDAGELTPSEFQNMFSVSIEKTEHVSLADLQGEVAPKTDIPDASGGS